MEFRVAWFADIFDEISGVVTDSVEVYEEALKAGVSWFPVTCYDKKIKPFFVFPSLLKISTNSVYKNSNLYIPNFLSILKFIKKNKINMIVSNTPASMGYTAMIAATFLKLPWVDIYHTDVDFYMNTLIEGRLRYIKNKFALIFLKFYHKRADLIFVRDRDSYELILKRGYAKEKICYYSAGVDQKRFHPKFKDISIWQEFGISPRKKIVLFVGRISKVKDIKFLLDFFKTFSNTEIVLVIVGKGPEYDDYLEEYDQHKNIYFLGIQRGEQLQKIYASADLSVSPSGSETLGKTVLEAMASGTTVLTSNKGGAKDYIQDSVNGKIFKAGDYNNFTTILLDFLSGKYDLEKMGKRAHQSIKPYTMDRLFHNFMDALDTLKKN